MIWFWFLFEDFFRDGAVETPVVNCVRSVLVVARLVFVTLFFFFFFFFFLFFFVVVVVRATLLFPSDYFCSHQFHCFFPFLAKLL